MSGGGRVGGGWRCLACACAADSISGTTIVRPSAWMETPMLPLATATAGSRKGGRMVEESGHGGGDGGGWVVKRRRRRGRANERVYEAVRAVLHAFAASHEPEMCCRAALPRCRDASGGTSSQAWSWESRGDALDGAKAAHRASTFPLQFDKVLCSTNLDRAGRAAMALLRRIWRPPSRCRCGGAGRRLNA